MNVVRERECMPPSHILVPLDGSPLANEALAHAVETYDCSVTVLNVVTPLDAGMSEGGILDLEDDRVVEARERAERLVKRACDDVGNDSVETVVETGDPADVIVEFVDEHDVDHVIMGGHGGDQSSVARRLLGTVATKVVGEAPVTVTVVR
jgi:nucleotide-binding universal stress UspA family protein